MLSIICWKWEPMIAGYRSTFGPETVNTLQRMVARNYQKPHRFICVTDDAKGIDASKVEIVPLWSDHATVSNPHGWHQPSCYRRLKAFSADAVKWFGPRFVSIDLDCVIAGDMSPIWDRPEDFVIWGETNKRSWYNGSMWMMTAGARKQVWDKFDPRISPMKAKRAGRFGSDQGWISYLLGPNEAKWGRTDGVYSYRVHIEPHGGQLPENARVIFFHGKHDPWHPKPMQLDWVREHYR